VGFNGVTVQLVTVVSGAHRRSEIRLIRTKALPGSRDRALAVFYCMLATGLLSELRLALMLATASDAAAQKKPERLGTMVRWSNH
jgi:hypothetical protein